MIRLWSLEQRLKHSVIWTVQWIAALFCRHVKPKAGEKGHDPEVGPCWVFDFLAFIKTCCGLSVSRFKISKICSGKLKSGRSISKWGCTLMKSPNKILTKVLGLSKCLQSLSKINSLALSTPEMNCKGLSILMTQETTSKSRINELLKKMWLWTVWNLTCDMWDTWLGHVWKSEESLKMHGGKWKVSADWDSAK